MTRLNWGTAGERFYEAGADRGVLYPTTGPGVAWNGLIAVSERPSGGDPTPYYYDGVKYLNISAVEEFEASLEAFSCPPEFAACDGTVSLHRGLFVTQQPRKSFGLSYRTLVGNDVDGLEHGYKIHLVYDALASPTERSNQTLGDDVDPTTLSWDITATPFDLPGIRPTAHLVIDSTTSDRHMLAVLEGYLHGANGLEPRLPEPSEVVALFRQWEFLEGFDGSLNFFGVASGVKTTVTNLATNPSFETTSGTVEVYRNLATNPSFENVAGTTEVYRNYVSNPAQVATSGTTEVRRNLYLRPLMESSTGVASVNGSAMNTVAGAGRIRVTALAGGTKDSGLQFTSNSPAVVAGDVITYSFDVTGVVSDSWRISIQGVAANITHVSGGATPVPAGSTVRLWARAVFTASGTPAVYLLRETAALASTAEVSRPLIEASPILEPYFDGATTVAGMTSSWTGATNASQSILTAPVPAANARTAVQTVDWQVPDPTVTGGFFWRSRLTGIVPFGVNTALANMPVGQYTLIIRARSNNTTSFISPRLMATPEQQIKLTTDWREYRWAITTTATSGHSGFIGASSAGWSQGDLIDIDYIAVVSGNYTGPYFDGSTQAAVRRNGNPNPNFQSAIAPWSASGTGAVSRSTEWSRSGSASAKFVTHSNVFPDSGDLRVGTASIMPRGLEAGKTYTVSAYIHTPAVHQDFNTTTASRQRRFLVFFSTDGTTVFTPGYGPQAPNTAGTHRIKHTFTIPANATGVILGIGSAGSQTDPSFVTYIDDILIEESSTLGDYFDGDTGRLGDLTTGWEGATNTSASILYDGDLTPSWTGTTNASASVLTGVAVAGPTSGSGVEMKAWRSPLWSSIGDNSLRMRPLFSSISASSFFAVPAATQAGKTYTAIAKVRLAAPLTGALRSESRNIQIRGLNGTVTANGTQAPNEAGVHEVRVTWQSIGSGDSIRLYHGGTNDSGDIWWDDLAIVEGNYHGPYFDGDNKPVVRRNLAIDPAGTGASWRTTRWFGSGGGAGTHSFVTGATDGPEVAPGIKIPTYRRKTWTISPANNIGDSGIDIRNDVNGGLFPTSLGQTFTVSGYMKHNGITAKGFYARIIWRDALDAQVGTAVGGTVVETLAGEWQRVSVTATAPAGATGYLVLLDVRNSGTGVNIWVAGESLDATALLVEESSTLGDYFDGNMTLVGDLTPIWEGTPNASPSILYDGDLTNSWTGTANASASVLTGVGAAGSSLGNSARAIQSAQWAASGTRSLRIIPNTTNPVSFADIGPITVVPGKTYTLLGKYRLETPLTGALNTTRLCLCARFFQGSEQILGDPGPNVVGVHTSRLVLTVPEGRTQLTVRPFNGASAGNGDVWWDDVMLVEGVYTGPYFDGSQSSVVHLNQYTNPVWTGTPNASTSKFDYFASLPEQASYGDANLIEGDLWVYQDAWTNHGEIPVIS